MAYFPEPSSVFITLNNIRLDSDYKNTIWFPKHVHGHEEQANYFLEHRDYTFTDFKYIREGDKVRIPVRIDAIQQVNYCMYKNTKHGDKWFYAFVLDAEYMNEGMSALTLQLDVMQSYIFDYELLPSFVEREIVANDLVPSMTIENLEFGDRFVRSKYTAGINANGQAICIASSVDAYGGNAVGGMYGGVYSGLNILPSQSYQDVNAYLESAVSYNKADSIISIFMMPARLFSNVNQKPVEYDVEIPMNKDFGGYIPKNNKLYMYPYNLLVAHNAQGNSGDYPYEYFAKKDGKVAFKIVGNTSPNPQVIAVPQNYKQNVFDTTAMLTISNFPQCSWTTDTYRAYLAQNANSLPVSLMSSAYTAGASLFNLNFGGAVSAGFDIAKTLAKVSDISTLPPQAHGASGSDVLYAYNGIDFVFLGMSISPYNAKIIDDYFSMFGYLCHEVKVPNVAVRQNWTYTKTIDVNIWGDVPEASLAIIRSVFNNGVTFWTKSSDIGNYNQENGEGLG